MDPVALSSLATLISTPKQNRPIMPAGLRFREICKNCPPWQALILPWERDASVISVWRIR